MIMHNWSDEACIQILRHLRAAATPDTHLVVIDTIISYACPEPPIFHIIPGSAPDFVPPAPLLANVGTTSATDYLLDLTVRTVHVAHDGSSC